MLGENAKDTQTVIDLSHVLTEAHENKWVALSPDYSRVIAVADNLRDLDSKVGSTQVVYHRVLPHDVSFAPHAIWNET